MEEEDRKKWLNLRIHSQKIVNVIIYHLKLISFIILLKADLMIIWKCSLVWLYDAADQLESRSYFIRLYEI